MRNMESTILGGVLALGLGLAFNVQAGVDPVDCSMAKWTGGATVPGNAVGTPFSAPAVARYSESCGLAVSATGYVQSPATSDTHYFGRFYVLPQSSVTGTVDLLVAYSDTGGASPVFTVSYDGTDFLFNAVAGGNGSATAQPGKWNLVEFEFNSGGDFNVWVNETWNFDINSPAYTTGPSDTFASGAGTIASVRLGAINGVTGGSVIFDAFEAHRTTNVGALLRGDANQDGSVNTGDIGTIINEFFNVGLATGQPDCNRDGSVNTGDIGCVINIFFNVEVP